MTIPHEQTGSRKLWTAGTLTYTAGGLAVLFFFLLWGDFTWSMRERAVLPSATLLIKQIGVTEFVYGLIIVSFPNFTNIFLSPIISYLSDRHRGRWGRRIPYLLFTTPFIVLGLYGLGCTNVFGEAIHAAYPAFALHHARLLIFCISWVLLDFGTTLASSLFNALVNDVVPHPLLGRFFSLFRLVSLGAGMIFNYWLIDKVEAHTMAIFLSIGTLYAAGLLSLCFMVKEGEYSPPPEETHLPKISGRPQISVTKTVLQSSVTYLRQSFSMPYYCYYMAAWSLAFLAFMPVNTFAIQYAGNVGVDMKTYGQYLVVICSCSFVLSYLLGILADKFHPLRMSMLALLAYVFLMAAGYFLMKKPSNFGLVFILHGVFSGCYFTFSASLPSRLLPPGLFAQFSSATGIVLAVFNMLLAPIIGKTLDLLHYNYSCLFPIAGVITLAALAIFVKVYRDFLKFGGDADYQAPIPD